MPRPAYPPYGFTCPYTHRCPHLDGLSTTWVFEEYQRAEEAYQEHLRIIEVADARLNAALKQVRMLEKENAELKAKNTALHRRQFKANKATPSETEQERGSARKNEGLLSVIPDGRDPRRRRRTEPSTLPPLRYAPIAGPIIF